MKQMYLKNNQNKNKINIPAPIGANQKVGIFFSKQQKTKQLQEQNRLLQQKISIAMQEFKEQNQLLKQLKIKNSTNQNLIEAISVQNDFLSRQNQTKQQEKQKLIQQQTQLKQQQSTITSQLITIQKQLFDNTRLYEQKSNLLNRYHQEIKNQKTLRYTPDSIVNVVSKLQKDYQLLQRNLTIHENKLQSKKKYLKLLDKKEQKEIKKEIENNYNKLGSPKKTLNIYEKTHTNKFQKSNYKSTQLLKQRLSYSGKQIKQNYQIQKQNKKQELKKFNQINRKKNQIMAKNMKKKP